MKRLLLTIITLLAGATANASMAPFEPNMAEQMAQNWDFSEDRDYKTQEQNSPKLATLLHPSDLEVVLENAPTSTSQGQDIYLN